jgi:hypothetical protein
MTPFALGLSALATLLFIPLTSELSEAVGPNGAGAGIAVIFLGFIRAGLLILGLIASVAAGEMGVISDSRGVQGVLLFAAVILVEVVSCGLHFGAVSAKDHTMQYVAFEAAATVLPVLLIATGFLASRGNPAAPMLLVAAVIAPVLAGVVGMAASSNVSEEKRVQQAEMEQARQDRQDDQMADLNEVPANANVAELLEFVAEDYDYYVQRVAIGRSIDTPGAVEQLDQIPEGPAKKLANSIRSEVVKEVASNQKIKAWRAIPETAALEEQLRFGGPDEPSTVLEEMHTRVRARTGAESELRAALQGRWKVGALGVLDSYDRYKLSDEAIHDVFAAMGKIAAEYDARMDSGTPPSKEEVTSLLSIADRFVSQNSGIAKLHVSEIRANWKLSERAEKELNIHRSMSALGLYLN